MPNPSYTCNLLVISCIDFRIQPLVASFVRKEFPGESYDYATFAGSVKNLHVAEKQVEVSEQLHNIQHVILIVHEDCGAYGKIENTKELQIQDMLKAKKHIAKLYPSLDIHLFY